MSGGETIRGHLTLAKPGASAENAQDLDLLRRSTRARVRWAIMRLTQRVTSCPPDEWRDECLARLREISDLLALACEPQAPARSGAEAA